MLSHFSFLFQLETLYYDGTSHLNCLRSSLVHLLFRCVLMPNERVKPNFGQARLLSASIYLLKWRLAALTICLSGSFLSADSSSGMSGICRASWRWKDAYYSLWGDYSCWRCSCPPAYPVWQTACNCRPAAGGMCLLTEVQVMGNKEPWSRCSLIKRELQKPDWISK